MKNYVIKRVDEGIEPDADAGKAVWRGIEALTVGQYLKRPEFLPEVQAKAVYDDEALYVLFEVEDRYVVARSENYQDGVCNDSCVEFFFAPCEDVSLGYFNIEINCGGVLLMHHQVVPRKNKYLLPADEGGQIVIAHSMPSRVESEIAEPTRWVVEYKVPMSILQKYGTFVKPEAGVEWRGNFYHCADGSSHPRWLTWSPLTDGRLDFHRPECFGRLVFG